MNGLFDFAALATGIDLQFRLRFIQNSYNMRLNSRMPGVRVNVHRYLLRNTLSRIEKTIPRALVSTNLSICRNFHNNLSTGETDTLPLHANPNIVEKYVQTVCEQ